jgi:hypothetical protein
MATGGPRRFRTCETLALAAAVFFGQAAYLAFFVSAGRHPDGALADEPLVRAGGPEGVERLRDGIYLHCRSTLAALNF